VALVRTDVSEELSASFIRVTRIGELRTIPAVSSNRRTLRRNTFVLKEPHGVTSQKTPFFILTAVKTSNLTWIVSVGPKWQCLVNTAISLRGAGRSTILVFTLGQSSVAHLLRKTAGFGFPHYLSILVKIYTSI
jgi:hypothetical protein